MNEKSARIERRFPTHIKVLSGLAAIALLGTTIATNADRIYRHFNPSPEVVLKRAHKAFAETGAKPSDCYSATMDLENTGVIADLVDEVRNNNPTNFDHTVGFSGAGKDIYKILSAMHKLEDSDHSDAVQLGDQYEYCLIDSNGKYKEVVLGNPDHYKIVVR